jgi:hypothetical protein
MSDVGGAAEIRSAPGSPTTVRLRWAAHPALTTEPKETTEVKAAYARDAVRAVGGAALLWQAFLGAVLIGRWGHYSKPEVMLGIWALTCLALGGCVRAAQNVGATQNVGARPNARAVQDARATPDAPATPARPTAAVKYVPNAAVASAVVAVLTGQVLAGVNGTPTDPIPLNWAMSSTYGVVAFLTAASTPRQLLSASLSFVLGSIAVASAYLADAAAAVTYLGAFLYVQAVILLVVGVVGPLRRQTAQATIRAARADAELANRLRATAAVRHDRHDRLRRLRADALPLLAAIGAGQLDPGSPEVRQRCAACATRLRRILRDGHGTDDLLGGLEPAVRAAEARGVAVVTQVAGRIDGPPEPARHEVVREVSRVLGRVADGCALLTLTGDADSGSAFVSFTESSAPTSAPDVGGRPSASTNPGWVEVDEDSDNDDVSVEVRWHAPH